MAFQSLYRKYRPQRFAELVGQEHVTTALRNAVRDDRVGHAYLFSGPRGTGKTTTARLLAKALNCLNLGDDAEPCCECENCVAIAAGTFGDLVELDAASHTGVDAMRDLVERVSLGLGATSKRKVYLIDEVHMLSTAASNALLKTLEEPPAHVVFVLATTNPEKVLPTIRSRTQHFELTLLSVEQLTALLGDLLDREGVQYEDDALGTIARAGAGSARDAESLLDQALAHADGALTAEDVGEVFGGSPFDARLAILEAVATEDPASALVSVAELLEKGHDPRRVAEDLLRTLRDAFLLVAARGRVAVEVPGEQRERIEAVGEQLGNGPLVRALETLGQAVVDMRGTEAADPRLVLEVALVRLARRDTGSPVQVLTERVERLERALADGTAPAAGAPSAGSPPERARPRPANGPRPALGAYRSEAESAPPVPAAPTADASAPAPPADAPPPAPPGGNGFTLDDAIVAWEKVLEGLPRGVRVGVQEAQPVAVDANVITFGVSRRQLDTVKPRFQKEAQTIREAFIAQLGAPPKFKFVVHDFTGGGGPEPEPAKRAAKPKSAPKVERPKVERPKRAARADAPAPPADDDPPPTDADAPPPDDGDDAVDLTELVDAPADAGAVDSVTRLQDVFGATVVEEQARD